jgi:hypothetical protein
MNFLTWNAGRDQFAKKMPLLDPFQPDVAVVPEIGRPQSVNDHCLWFGIKENQGLAVVSSQAFQLEPLPEKPGAPKYVVPIKVTGPINFTLFAIWTIQGQEMRYIRAVATCLDLYLELFAQGPIVLMGDFNSNAIWDKEHPTNLCHSAVVRKLGGLGIVSAYHHYRSEEHGCESEPTFFLHHKKEKPFHIDYCFLPITWANKLSSIQVGSFEAWQGLSDHRPLVLEMQVP